MPGELDPQVQQRTFDEALPLLRYIRDTGQVIDGVLPPDDWSLPGIGVRISPFYMNKYDPDTLGVWRVETTGSPDEDISARVTSIPTIDKVHYEVSVKGEDGNPRKATPEESAKVVHILASVTDRVVPEAPAVDGNKRLGTAKRIAKLLRGSLGRDLKTKSLQ